MMITMVVFSPAFIEGSYRSCVKYERHLAPEDRIVCVDLVDKCGYMGDSVKLPILHEVLYPIDSCLDASNEVTCFTRPVTQLYSNE